MSDRVTKKRVAIVTDSNSGMKQTKEIPDLFLLSMPFSIGGEIFYEDINLSQAEFYRYLKADMDIHTSQPSPQAIISLWEKILCEYDELVHIPMSNFCKSKDRQPGEEDHDECRQI